MKNLFTKKILFVLSLSLILLTNIAEAKNYYISATGNNTNSGLTPATAWQSLTKLNASFASITTGDSILFKSGETFYGTLTPTVSGITFGAYGSGAKPVITGLTTVSAWTSLGGNIWEAAVPGGLTTLNMVVINGKPTAMGRYPNADATNGGYLSYESFSNGASITDNQLSGAANWAGAEVVIRQSDFVVKRLPITSNSGTKISFTGATNLNANYGYFVQDHISTLDQNGEWFYDAATRKIKMFYTSTPPAIQVSTSANLVTMMFNAGTKKLNVTFKGIAFKGSEGVIMNIQYCDNITIDGCDFSLAGVDAIDHRNMANFVIKNTSFTDLNMNGIHETNPGTGDRITIQNDVFRRIGTRQGMISANTMYADRQATGINIGATNLLISENTFDSVGYAGVSLLKERINQVISKNTISNFCLTLNDGGGIYVSGLRGDVMPSNAVTISNNFVFKSGDPSAGTTSNYKHTRAIYLDATSTKINVLNNTIFNAFEGIYMSSAQHNTISGNTVYDVGVFGNGISPAGCLATADANAGYQHTRFNTITNNIFFAKYPDQLPYLITDIYGGKDSVGVIDSNYYVNPSSTVTNMFVLNYGPNNTKYSFSSWRAASPHYDAHSFNTPVTTPALTPSNVDNYLRFHYNPTNSPVTVTFTGASYMDSKGVVYNNSVVIPAWSSKVLINNGTVAVTNVAPKANAGADIIVTLPANSTTLAGTATDTDGTISSYAWLKISGPASATFTAANAANTSVSNLGHGAYEFELTVTDNKGAIGKDTVRVVINEAPVANAGTDKSTVLPNNTITLAGTATDVDGTVSNYGWSKISGPSSATIATANTANTSVNDLVQGVYQFELKVIDSKGAISRDTMQVTVNAAAVANKAPIANAGNDLTITSPVNKTTLHGTGIKENGTIKGYSWRIISGPASGKIAMADSASTLVTKLVLGDYKFELTVTDNNGATAKDTVNVKVSRASRQAPVATKTSVNNNAGKDTVQLTVNTTIVDQAIVANQLKVYPNPVRDIANLEITSNGAKKVAISVVDLSGRQVKYTEQSNLNKNNTVKLDMSSLQDGYYIITVRFDDGQKLSSKIIKTSGR
ncbi:MAG: T9SS type A sorting domain-containing protein [Ferruginibacter sp.]